MRKKRWAALALAAVLALAGCSFGGSGGGGTTVQKIDRPAVESTEEQFTHPAAGDTVAVFDTSAGVFKAVLFPDKAPQAYDNFTGLVQQGYYNGLTVSRVESGFVVEAGQGTDGKGTTIWSGRPLPGGDHRQSAPLLRCAVHGRGCFRRVRQRVLCGADPAGRPVGDPGTGG